MYKKVKFYEYSFPDKPVKKRWLPRSPYEHENQVSLSLFDWNLPPDGFNASLRELLQAKELRCKTRTVDMELDRSVKPYQVRLRLPYANDPLADVLAHGPTLLDQDEKPIFVWIDTRDGRFDFAGLKPDAEDPPPGCEDTVCPRLYRQADTGKEHVLRWFAPWPVDYGAGIAPWKVYAIAKRTEFRSELENQILVNLADRWLTLLPLRAFVNLYNRGHHCLAVLAQIALSIFQLLCVIYFLPLWTLASVRANRIWFRRKWAAWQKVWRDRIASGGHDDDDL